MARSLLRRVKDKNGNSSRKTSRSLEPPKIPTPFRKKATRLSFFVKSLISGLAQIYSAAFFGYGVGLRLPCTSFFRSAVSFMSIRPLSLAAIARERENCFRSQRSIQQPPNRERQTVRSIIPKIFLLVRRT